PADLLGVRDRGRAEARDRRRHRARGVARAPLQPVLSRRIRSGAGAPLRAPCPGAALMENQGKRLLLAVGLALAVILGWNLIFPPKKEDPSKTLGSGSVATEVAPQPAPGVAPPPP